MTRFKTFEATGVAPAGRLYAGDLNAIQDRYADLSNFTQTVDVSTIRLGTSDVQILKFGTAEAQVTAALRVSGLLRPLGGVANVNLTSTQRDALGAGSRPPGLTIYNTTTSRIEVNAGSDATPAWQQLIPSGQVTNADVASNAAIAKSKLAALAIVNADVAAGAGISVNKLAPGSDGQFLQVVGGVAVWGAAPSGGGGGGIADPGTKATDDVLTWSGSAWVAAKINNAKVASGAAIAVNKLAPGSDGQYLSVSGGSAVWTSAPAAPTPGTVADTDMGHQSTNGAASTYARSDHQHRVGTVRSPVHVQIYSDSDLSGTGDIIMGIGGGGGANDILRVTHDMKLGLNTPSPGAVLNVRIPYVQTNSTMDGLGIIETGLNNQIFYALGKDASGNFRGVIRHHVAAEGGDVIYARYNSVYDYPQVYIGTSQYTVPGDAENNGGEHLYVSGTAFSFGWLTSSDRALKKNIKEVQPGILASMKKVPANKFQFKVDVEGAPAGERYGLIADEIEAEFPEVVSGTAMKKINVDQLIAILWGAVKELAAEVDELKAA